MLTPNLSSEVTEFLKGVQTQGESERFWALNRLEAIWTGQRYQLEARPSFWDQSVPLRERAPCVQSHLPRTAGLRLAHMVMGSRSFPALTIKGGGYGSALTPKDLALVQALVDELIAASKLSLKAREYLIEGLKTGTSVAIQSLCQGKPSIQILPAKWCTPLLDTQGQVLHMVVQYKIPSTTPGTYQWYRREIGGGLDRVWKPVPVTKVEPKWESLPLESEGILEFTPVVWTRSLAEGVDEGSNLDGHALAEGLEDEVEALDMELSQLYRTAIYNGDPQMVRTGTDPDEAPSPMGEQGPVGGVFSWFNGKLSGRSGEQALKKAPGKVWNLPEGGDAKLLESNGSGAKIIEGAISQLRRVATDALGVVLADPDTLGAGELSARALTLMFGPMLDTCDNLRATYGDAITLIVGQLLRLCAGEQALNGGVHLQSWEDAKPALAKMFASKVVPAKEEGGEPTMERVWCNPTVSLGWGDYFSPSWSEVSSAVEATSKATGGKPVLSQRQAVTLLAKLTGVSNVEDELAQLASEASPLPTP